METAICPTTGVECKVLDHLVNIQENLLGRLGIGEWGEEVQSDIAEILGLGQESCTYEKCGVSGLRSAMEMVLWADKKAKGE